MLELLVFGSFAFYVIFGILGFAMSCMIYSKNEAPAFVLSIIAVIATFLCVTGKPDFQLWWFGAYAGGAAIWLPIYWYSRLRENRAKLIELSSGSRREYERHKYGDEIDGKWVPKHPDKEDLVAASILWPIHAPVHLLRNIIDAAVIGLKGWMEKIRKSMAVEIE